MICMALACQWSVHSNCQHSTPQHSKLTFEVQIDFVCFVRFSDLLAASACSVILVGPACTVYSSLSSVSSA